MPNIKTVPTLLKFCLECVIKCIENGDFFIENCYGNNKRNYFRFSKIEKNGKTWLKWNYFRLNETNYYRNYVRILPPTNPFHQLRKFGQSIRNM
jgi:hypothetical protein